LHFVEDEKKMIRVCLACTKRRTHIRGWSKTRNHRYHDYLCHCLCTIILICICKCHCCGSSPTGHDKNWKWDNAISHAVDVAASSSATEDEKRCHKQLLKNHGFLVGNDTKITLWCGVIMWLSVTLVTVAMLYFRWKTPAYLIHYTKGVF
jgi:hypothetical protein